MELLQLTYFCDAAESENFTKTAQKYGVPASNISQTVHRLEKELGISLFDRRANKATLNEAGRVFYEKVKQSLAVLEEGKLRLRDLKGEVSGEVRLLILTNRNTVTKAIERFKQKYPAAVFSVSHRQDNAEDDFDFIISDEPPFGRHLEKRLLITDEMMLAVQKGSRWDVDKIDLSLFRNERFISMHSNSSLYRTAYRICADFGFAPNIAI